MQLNVNAEEESSYKIKIQEINRYFLLFILWNLFLY